MAESRSGTSPAYSEQPPDRAELDATHGAVVVEFGTDWCGHCRRARPLIETAFASHPRVRHFRVADGPGRRLGRSFRVKLWPTLVFLIDGEEVMRLVRPSSAGEIGDALARIDR